MKNQAHKKKVCGVCQKAITAAHYARHLASHESVIHCQHCPVIFTRQDNYKRHLKFHGDNLACSNSDEAEAPTTSTTVVIDEENLKSSLRNFHVSGPDIPSIKTPNFLHPFSCKIVGPRGSGKTSFTVSYIQQIACQTFSKIFIVTGSLDQPLYNSLKENSQIYFVTFKELEAVISSNRDILLVLDDVMQEVRYNSTIETVFTRGRHQRISIMSLEQDLSYSNYVERRNVDYYILTRMRDTSCLNEFYKRFCRDVQQWRFISLYELVLAHPLGFLIIDFVSQIFKYRVNSLNMYYDINHCTMRYIFKDDERKLEEFNNRLLKHFTESISALKRGKGYTTVRNFRTKSN
jgi:hypothetical protein